MTGELAGIVGFLEQATHPEVHHFRDGSHPGLGWWLKTVCPDPEQPFLDINDWGATWKRYARQNPGLVRLVPVAFDWSGEPIPGTVSVWVCDDIDIIAEPLDHGLLLRVTAKHATDREAAQALGNLLAGRGGPEAAEIARAAEALERDAASHEPALRRSQLTVIRGED